MARRTMFTRSVVCVLLVLALSAVATAQTDVVLYGRVTGEDHTGPPPPTWSVTVTTEYSNGDVGPTRTSQNDLYAYRVLVGRTQRLVYQAPGYRHFKGDWLTQTADDRVRPDIVLEKYGPQMTRLSTSDPDAIEKDLAEQAELARRTGATDIFLANYAIQKKILLKRPAYAAAVDGFEKKNASFHEVVKTGEVQHLDLEMMARLVDDDPASVTTADAEKLLSWSTMETLTPALRARAIDKLSGLPLSADVSVQVRQSFRTQASSSHLPVRIAALSALMKLGPAADLSPISPDFSKAPTWLLADVVDAARQSKQIAESDTDKALARVAMETLDPSTQVLAVRGLSHATGGTAQQALLVILKKKNAPAVVRLEAVKSLAPGAAHDGEARELLKVLAVQDPSADVRLAAAGAVGQP